MIMVDYWSNFFEVLEIHKKTAQTVFIQLKEQFAPYGISQILITDNDQELSGDWEFLLPMAVWASDV